VTLSIRARLTAWYAAVVVVAFAAGAVVIAQVQTRVALNRLDDELARLQHTVTAVLHNEFGEGLDLPGAIKEASVEVVAEGRTVVVSRTSGLVLGTWGDALPDGWSLPDSSMRASGGTRWLAGQGFRAAQVPVRDGDHAFVVTVLARLDPLARERNELLRALGIGTIVALLVAMAGGWLVGRHAIEPAALHAQRQFMADASHQLRTPVSIIRTTAQVILAKDQRSESEYRESTTIVAEQSARLTRLVDAMFLLARGDAGGRTLRTAAIYLDELVGECIRGLSVVATERQVRLESSGDVDVQLFADEELLRQMLLNLLDNAIRHTPPGGIVRTTIAAKGDTVVIAVEDGGAGIPIADRERIFERFVRLHQGSDGAGLGLPLARWIAEAHRGSLTLEASGPRGSRFAVRLPR
jgi:signal transduction histidine kinase